ncbi:putative spermidine/putrescine transporter subunit; ATP-binding component of ABC superfamily tranporter [Beijerinckiaceae bacterium RH AL1]|nr:ABC transporter ATP-binding protein [Beijerinckiaceae bacterium]VVB49346.1 putative spermidine/putrescine transporter subunit; ATP-binding component of ABC superfamily tranporter [Beijerinckiaceae bacterium RH CH11]VVB49426.1 putative spermidine/putrescine transporter subunit; ATP-binding component of ABC superfamily tranporter [Beijerinckiaceae bacterium RH AL8]VVC56855.1 putative spermidine/putrescine transporter subunit; ATP-binding component of ABC superfamily tranporter [Beijerinckiaceae
MNVLARAPKQMDTTVADDVVLRLRGVRKTYKGAVAVESVDLDVRRGEFLTLLGPSGSGKTTTLRMIAGFELPDAGTIELDGVDVARVAPFDRNVNTVFQDYALFPHMSVADNIAYGLRAKGVKREECAARVEQVLQTVQLGKLAQRRPHQLSGGQRQRVGLARAIVNRPLLLLLDEPLGALDLKLRREMQLELKHIQDEVGITFLYVTHDQEEALSMSSRIAIFNEGRIEQLDTPREIYDRPASAFVAGFVGTSSLVARDGRLFVLRPEKVRIAAAGAPLPDGLHVESGRIEDEVFLGAMTKVVVALDDGTRVESHVSHAETLPRLHDPIRVAWDPAAVATLPLPK